MIRVAACIACLLLVACGQRGALYIPDDSRPTAVPASATATPAPGATGDDASATEEERQRRQQAAPANNAAGN